MNNQINEEKDPEWYVNFRNNLKNKDLLTDGKIKCPYCNKPMIIEDCVIHLLKHLTEEEMALMVKRYFSFLCELELKYGFDK